jgi:hypothetical protein
MGVTCLYLLDKCDEIMLHPPCIALSDTEIFIHDKYRENFFDIRYIVAYRDSIVWPINHLNVKVFDEICSELTVGYNNCIQDVDFYVRHALTFVNVPDFQISHDETLDNKPVKCRIVTRPGFRGTSWIQASVSRVPTEPFPGRELCRIWSIARLIINFLFSAVQHRLIIRH